MTNKHCSKTPPSTRIRTLFRADFILLNFNSILSGIQFNPNLIKFKYKKFKKRKEVKKLKIHNLIDHKLY